MRRGLAILVLFGGSLLADEETASYFLERAQRALQANKLEEAASFVEKSLGEKEDYAPALVFSAELARRNGDKATAIRHLENCLAQSKNRPKMSLAEREALKAAQFMLESLDKAGTKFRALLARHVDKVLELGNRSRKSKPDLARECYRTVLRLDPENEKAQRRTAELSGRKEPAKLPGRRVFNGKNLKNWTGLPPVFTVKKKLLRCETVPAALCRLKESFKGDFAVLVELRQLELTGPNPMFGIGFGVKDPYNQTGIWIWKDYWKLARFIGEDKQRRIAEKDHPAGFDRTQWHTYRFVRKGEELTCYVDGVRLFATTARPDEPLDGFMALWVQEQVAEVRTVLLEE